MQCKLIFLFLVLSMLCGCRGEESALSSKTGEKQMDHAPRQKGCPACHPEVAVASPHDFACVECHRGDAAANQQEVAHAGLVARPAHPDQMRETCGVCHGDSVRQCADSLHFTLRNEVNQVRGHFGATEPLSNLTEIPVSPEPSIALELADDLLRRRCLRCHVFTPGDEYPLTLRGTGCAACHLAFAQGKLQSHQLLAKPTDQQCLSCHYGNAVGADYYGRYEHDYNWEYRTPYVTREPYIRAYGVEYHDLVPDIHQQRGLACIDCHQGHQLMAGGQNLLTCATCHRSPQNGNGPLPGNVTQDSSTLVLTSTRDGKKHVIPQLVHPAHAQYGQQVACQVCHAQWGFNDSTTHLLRSETDDFLPWERLTVQGSSALERLLEHNLNSGKEELPPVMRDGITGETRPGVWYQGFTQRRWENMLFGRDSDGVIKVFRPVLDLRLSAVASDGTVLLDSAAGIGPGLLPYTPHTTGAAGLFYRHRFAGLLEPPSPTDNR
ncbi:MAG TPA: hypothetical protein DDY20_08245 [Desulfobulbaceae bacterium]|nr:hypothetical protein [Desulfobulbaceae bacterium]